MGFHVGCDLVTVGWQRRGTSRGFSASLLTGCLWVRRIVETADELSSEFSAIVVRPARLRDGDGTRIWSSSGSLSSMVVSDVMGDKVVAATGLGHPNEGIPKRLRVGSEPDRARWNGNVRVAHMLGLESLDETSPADGLNVRCFFLIVDFSSNVTFFTTFGMPDSAVHATSRVARLAAATPCSP